MDGVETEQNIVVLEERVASQRKSSTAGGQAQERALQRGVTARPWALPLARR